jgi:hypothetical protein
LNDTELRIHLVILIIISFTACQPKSRKLEVSYFKVLNTGYADSITPYNKGISLGDYVYYDAENDSLICRYLANGNSGRYNAFTSNLSPIWLDDVYNAIGFLKQNPSGLLPVPHEDYLYCGPTLYVEFEDAKGIHYYAVQMGINEALDRFIKLFFELRNLAPHRTAVEASFRDGESEAVEAWSNLGKYQERKIYIPLPCKKGVARSKIPGVWRLVSKYDADINTYSTLTITTDGKYHFGENYDEITKIYETGTIIVHTKDNRFDLKTPTRIESFVILNLSENCFEYTNDDGSRHFRYDRVFDSIPGRL